jgi:heme oxygenase (biliverdin-IX-beta and delta-forming)
LRMENKVTNSLNLGARQADVGRAKRLREATREMHERLDKSIMMHKAFESRARYGLFVKVQHQFHREIDALYANQVLDKLLPDLWGRRRFDLIERDLVDLRVTAPSLDAPPAFASSTEADLPTALGWLYVAEGSNLGAAFLLNEARKLGLSETFGARHLAGAPEGRGLHWKTFTVALDGVSLTGPEEERVIAGARAAFACVQRLVNEVFSAH